MFRTTVLALILAITATSSAQQISPPLGKSNWERVQGVSTATPLHMSMATAHIHCALKTVDAESLTCVDNYQNIVFKRTEIKSIKISRRSRSAWVGEGIAFLAFFCAALAVNGGGHQGSGAAAVVGFVGLIGLIASPIIGYFADFMRTTVYSVD